MALEVRDLARNKLLNFISSSLHIYLKKSSSYLDILQIFLNKSEANLSEIK